MSFVEGFFRFDIRLFDAEHSLERRLHFKVPKHPLESLENLLGRVLAFLHGFREGVELTPTAFDPILPTFCHLTVEGNFLLWAQVGSCDARRLLRALRGAPRADFRLYIFDLEDLKSLAGAVPNWKAGLIEHVQLYQIDASELEPLLEELTTSNVLTLTRSDETLFIEMDGVMSVVHLQPKSLVAELERARSANPGDRPLH